MTTYLHREVTEQVARALESLPVVVLSGPRQVGKSTFLQSDPLLRDRRYVTLDDYGALLLARENPDALLEGDDPLTIDEAQRCPELLLAVKRHVDRRRRRGRFLLSGSANFLLLRSVGESLAGRAVYLHMAPFSRREQRRGTSATPFLVEWFTTGSLPKQRDFDAVRDEDVLTGGFPVVALGEAKDRSLWLRGYEQTYLERDLRDLSQVGDLLAFRRVLQLVAFRTGQIGNESAIGRDAKLSAATAGRYLDLLETSFLLSRLPPFVRGKQQRLIKTPKLYLADSALAAHLVGAETLDPAERMRGPLYETYVAQNLRSILGCHLPNAELLFWNVQGRHEVDFVVATPRGEMAVEVKASARFDDRDLAGLRAFGAQHPSARALVLGYQGQETLSLGDRVFVVPLGLLLS